MQVDASSGLCFNQNKKGLHFKMIQILGVFQSS